MGKKKGIIAICAGICVLLLVAGVFLLQPKDEGKVSGNKPGTSQDGAETTEPKDKIVTLEQAKEQFASDIKELKDGTYENLIAKDFTASIEAAKGLYHFQILRNQEFETTLENVDGMIEAMEKFFGDSFDKSNLYHNAFPLDENGELQYDATGVELNYDEVMDLLREGKNNQYSLIGGFVLSGGFYAHIDPAFGNTWFSKRSLGTSMPGDYENTKEYLYVTGIRQSDTVVQLRDQEYQLSELEKKVLDYVNGDAFPLPHHEEISYQIGTTHIIATEEKEYINFVLRRVYKGVPFEYGSEFATDGYRDKLGHDYTRVNYIEGTQPDTIMGFMNLKGTVDIIEQVTQMIPAREALRLLSEQIGENSVYEVHGVELVYRECEVPEDKKMEISDILEPKWKIITINQNDDKYTLFYVDVVTGEITNRFEYYYD
ncbi:MAG: hypothetical protein IJ455_08515 [Agathobacter sp.]|nr:hypothetical protein [Agathobacter sp.]